MHGVTDFFVKVSATAIGHGQNNLNAMVADAKQAMALLVVRFWPWNHAKWIHGAFVCC
jgi:hypothetical protein